MAKLNISISATNALSWDQYMNKPVEEVLPAIYTYALNTSRKVCDWYWHSIKIKRRTSLFSRAAIFFIAIIGTAMPVLSGFFDTDKTRLLATQFGVIALAIGAVLLYADQVFGWSSGWLRYVRTVTSLENLVRKFELDWASYVLGKGGALDSADAKYLFDLAKQLEIDTFKQQSDETDQWAAEFTKGTNLLNDLIKTQREQADRAVEAARAAVAAQQQAQKNSGG